MFVVVLPRELVIMTIVRQAQNIDRAERQGMVGGHILLYLGIDAAQPLEQSMQFSNLSPEHQQLYLELPVIEYGSNPKMYQTARALVDSVASGSKGRLTLY